MTSRIIEIILLLEILGRIRNVEAVRKMRIENLFLHLQKYRNLDGTSDFTVCF